MLNTGTNNLLNSHLARLLPRGGYLTRRRAWKRHRLLIACGHLLLGLAEMRSVPVSDF